MIHVLLATDVRPGTPDQLALQTLEKDVAESGFRFTRTSLDSACSALSGLSIAGGSVHAVLFALGDYSVTAIDHASRVIADIRDLDPELTVLG